MFLGSVGASPVMVVSLDQSTPPLCSLTLIQTLGCLVRTCLCHGQGPQPVAGTLVATRTRMHGMSHSMSHGLIVCNLQ
jgi:hypothetical protein